jgi:hypothetical protein
VVFLNFLANSGERLTKVDCLPMQTIGVAQEQFSNTHTHTYNIVHV